MGVHDIKSRLFVLSQVKAPNICCLQTIDEDKLYLFVIYYVIAVNVSLLSHTSNARFYELGLTHDSRVIPGLTVVSVLSTSNLGLNWD